MSWLDNVRPRIQQLVRRTPPPTDLWRQCPECLQMLFERDLERAGMVCPNCSRHLRIGAEARFKLLFDEDSIEAIEMPATPVDPLKFRDRKRYTDRLKEAHAKNGDGDALKAAYGAINGAPAAIANAISDALSPLGVEVTELPASPERRPYTHRAKHSRCH